MKKSKRLALKIICCVLASDNVEALAFSTVDIGFAYSDHNPVKFEFILK